jgi:nicotinamidase-related amidase
MAPLEAPTGTALLVLHMQNGVVARYPETGPAVVDRIAAAVGAARSRDVPVIFVRMAFRKGRPEMRPERRTNPFFAEFEPGEPSVELADGLGARPDDLVVDGSRGSAFKGTDLAILLRALGARRLVLTGIGTSGVVLSTLIEAADLDYEVTVLADGCTDPDDEVHRVLCGKVFPVRAAVITTQTWISSLG